MKNNRINYIELPAEDMQSAKDFYGKVFGWQFEDYGPDYCAFNDGNMEGGFYHSPLQSNSSLGAALVVLFSDTCTLKRLYGRRHRSLHTANSFLFRSLK